MRPRAIAHQRRTSGSRFPSKIVPEESILSNRSQVLTLQDFSEVLSLLERLARLVAAAGGQRQQRAG